MFRFLRDGGLLFLAEGISRLVAFSVTFVIARRVGLSEVAVITLAQSLLAYATVAGDGGMGTGAVTRIVGGESVRAIVRGTARTQLGLTLVASLVVVPIVASSAGWPLAIVLAATPFAIASSTSYVLQARQDVASIAAARISGNVVTAGVGVLAASSALPLPLIAAAYPLGALTTALVGNLRAGTRPGDLLGRPSLAFLLSDWKHGLGLFGYTLTVHFYASVLLILSSTLSGGANLVDIALATRLLLIFSIPAQIIESILLPRYARRSGSDGFRGRVLRDAVLGFVAGCIACAALVVAAPIYVPLLFGPSAEGAVGTVQSVVLQVPISIATSVLSAGLLARRRSLGLTIAYMSAAVIQVIWAVSFASSGPERMGLAIVVSEIGLALGAMVAFSRTKATPAVASGA